MSEKLSLRAQQALASEGEDSTCRLHVMLKRDLDEPTLERAIDRLAGISVDPRTVKLRKRSGIVDCQTRISTLPSIASLDEVIWVDLDSQVELGELLD